MLYSNSIQLESFSPFVVSSEERIQSLYDMLRFYATSFSIVMGELRSAVCSLSYIDVMDVKSSNVDVSDSWKTVENSLDGLVEHSKELPLSFAVNEQVKRVRESARDHSDHNVVIMITMIKELHNNILNELTQHLFFLVPFEFKTFYLNPEVLLGETCEAKFPNASRDAHDAVQCYVLDQWTASVFHSMRVLEHGLRWLCKEVGLENPDIDLENWKNILDQIEKKIRQMEALPKSVKKAEDLKFYSDAVSNFRYFKDAWRNHVSHARSHYDSKEAHRVLNHVADFMKHLATR